MHIMNGYSVAAKHSNKFRWKINNLFCYIRSTVRKLRFELVKVNFVLLIVDLE